jgi:hypothetical protein
MRDALPPPFTLNALAFRVFFFNWVPGVIYPAGVENKHDTIFTWVGKEIEAKINPDFFFRLLEKSKISLAFPLWTQVDKSDSGKCVPRAAREKKH